MTSKGGRKRKPQLYSHIASAIIPAASIVAVPSASQHFPQQKTRGGEEWGPIASTLLRASFTGQLLIPSPSMHSLDQDEDDYRQQQQQQHSQKRTTFGRIDASTDEDESDEEGQHTHRASTSQKSTIRSSAPRRASISDAEKRIFGQIMNDEESTTAPTGMGSTIHLDPKQALAAELSRSTTTTEDKNVKRVTVTRQHVPPLILNPAPSQSGPTSARATTPADGIGIEGKSLASTTARSSLNESTTIPMSARSVSFKDTPVIYEPYDPPSSKSQPSTAIHVTHNDSILEKIVIPPPEEYQYDTHELEKRNKLLNDEVQQLRLNNRNLQKQQDELFNRLQTSQKISQRDLNDLLKQAGRDQTKDLENLNQTLQNRCDQLQNELTSVRERYSQEQGQLSGRELKNENHFLRDYVHRLNATLSEYQALNPPDALKKDQRKQQSLPMKGPTPIWLLNQKFLAPLFVCYDEKLHEKDTFILRLQGQLNELQDQIKIIINENLSLHERVVRSSSSITNQNPTHLTDLENIKRQAYLVLEENKVLQEQLDLQTNRLTDVQKAQIQEISNLTRRLMIAESEKTEADRTLETIRMRNDDLRKKYEQLIIDNDHRIHVDEHVREMNEMKRLTNDLSEKHASEMQILLHRVKDAESSKKSALLKLNECRNDIEHLKTDAKETKKSNRKLQLRVQTYEKKLELQQIKEQQMTEMLEKVNEDAGRIKLEQETYSKLAKNKEEEANKARERMQEGEQKLLELENRLESYKSKGKERVTEAHEQLKKQYDNLKIRCSEHEQRNQKLISLLNEQQIIIDGLNSEKRNIEADLEQIWLTTNADNIRMREQLHGMRVTS